MSPHQNALERLILNQRRLHERVDCVRRLSQSIRDQALCTGVAGITFQLGQTMEQFVHEFLLLRGHCGSPRVYSQLCGALAWVTGEGATRMYRDDPQNRSPGGRAPVVRTQFSTGTANILNSSSFV